MATNLQSILLQRLFNLESKLTQYFTDNLSSYEWIHDPFVQPTPHFPLLQGLQTTG